MAPACTKPIFSVIDWDKAQEAAQSFAWPHHMTYSTMGHRTDCAMVQSNAINAKCNCLLLSQATPQCDWHDYIAPSGNLNTRCPMDASWRVWLKSTGIKHYYCSEHTLRVAANHTKNGTINNIMGEPIE